MLTFLRVTLGSSVAIALVVTGLWCWQHAGVVAGWYDVSRPEVLAWAARAAAVAAVALAQWLVLVVVVRVFYDRRWFDRALRVVSGLTFTAAAAGALAFVAAGR